MFLTALTISSCLSCTPEANMSRTWSLAVVTEESRDREGREERGMGSEVPNELREARRSFMDGFRLRDCIWTSLTALRVEGTSMMLPSASAGRTASWA